MKAGGFLRPGVQGNPQYARRYSPSASPSARRDSRHVLCRRAPRGDDGPMAHGPGQRSAAQIDDVAVCEFDRPRRRIGIDSTTSAGGEVGHPAPPPPRLQASSASARLGIRTSTVDQREDGCSKQAGTRGLRRHRGIRGGQPPLDCLEYRRSAETFKNVYRTLKCSERRSLSPAGTPE